MCIKSKSKISLSVLLFLGVLASPALAQSLDLSAIDAINQVEATIENSETSPETSQDSGQVPLNADQQPPSIDVPLAGAPDANVAGGITNQQIEPIAIQSLLFNYWEQTALIEAKRSAASAGLTRGVTEGEMAASLNMDDSAAKVKPPPEEREISLGGIVFTTSDDWTIWLNGQRVSPDALPKEVIDLKVYRHHVDMKWMDDYTLRLYPIRLRPHQRFNLDSRIFLPG